jgi:hypothetical protein
MVCCLSYPFLNDSEELLQLLFVASFCRVSLVSCCFPAFANSAFEPSLSFGGVCPVQGSDDVMII